MVHLNLLQISMLLVVVCDVNHEQAVIIIPYIQMVKQVIMIFQIYFCLCYE